MRLFNLVATSVERNCDTIYVKLRHMYLYIMYVTCPVLTCDLNLLQALFFTNGVNPARIMTFIFQPIQQALLLLNGHG